MQGNIIKLLEESTSWYSALFFTGKEATVLSPASTTLPDLSACTAQAVR